MFIIFLFINTTIKKGGLNNEKSFCLDCHSEDVGAVPPEEVK